METKESSYRDETTRGSNSFSEENVGFVSGISRPLNGTTRFRNITRIVPLLLFASLSLNLFQLVFNAFHRPVRVSLYAKLPEHEVNIPFHYSTKYGSDNHDDEEKEALWNSIDISEGFVALTHQESDALGLPRSKTFPWDLNKGMYVSHGHHALHCTTLLHAYTHDAHHGRKPLVSYHHVEHCLDLIRQDIICHADDFMDYTEGHGEKFLTGDNQPRLCRDWNKLSDWVKQRSACYKTVNITRAGEDHGVEHQLDRYTYCPEGSPYIPLIQARKDLGRPNPGNLDGEGKKALSGADAQADAEAVTEHNSNIMRKPLW